MEKGSLIERRLDNAVYNRISRKNKAVTGPGIGNDFSRVGNIILTDGNSEKPEEAWIKAMNNYACACAVPEGVRITMLLPESVKESQIKKWMDIFQRYADSCGVSIVGGHTQISDKAAAPFFAVQVFGTASGCNADKKSVRPGMGIVMCGYAGMLGTDILIRRNCERIKDRFGNMLNSECIFGPEACSILPAAETIRRVFAGSQRTEVPYIHDISCGGVYAALWQLGRWADCGLLADNNKIPIRQETIEICECLDVNPYLIDGTGGLLMICSEEDVVLRELENAGIKAEVIGRITEGAERMVAFGDGELRKLEPSSVDEAYR